VDAFQMITVVETQPIAVVMMKMLTIAMIMIFAHKIQINVSVKFIFYV